MLPLKKNVTELLLLAAAATKETPSFEPSNFAHGKKSIFFEKETQGPNQRNNVSLKRTAYSSANLFNETLFVWPEPLIRRLGPCVSLDRTFLTPILTKHCVLIQTKLIKWSIKINFLKKQLKIIFMYVTKIIFVNRMKKSDFDHHLKIFYLYRIFGKFHSIKLITYGENKVNTPILKNWY